MKKTMAVILAAAMLLSTTIGAYAADSSDKLTVSDRAVEVVEDFLNVYLSNSYLYTNDSFDEFTIMSASEGETGETFELGGKTVARADLEKNIDYLKDKNTYWQYVRKAQNIYRTDFNVDYYVQNVDISGNSASVTISAMMSFRYTDSKDVSYKEDVFTVKLLETGGRWVVVDACEPQDWFDGKYKYSSDFDLGRVLSEYAEEDPLLTNTDTSMDEPNETRSSSLSYDADNATAYAYTYTTSGSANPTSFYNSNFQSFSGADCMNFASQCVWAGFGGNNNTTSINNHEVPMDSSGSYEWYNSQTASIYTGSWTACRYFREYASYSNSDNSETGLRTVSYPIGEMESFHGYISHLYGSILHVPGSGGSDYGHAVFVTDVESSERSGVYYCAHTSMAKDLKVGDSWPTGAILIHKPLSFYSSSTLQSPIISVEMFRPVPAGTTLTLKANSNSICYSIQTRVTTPGNSTSTSTAYDTMTATRSYTFSSPGLYKIRIIAKRTASSAEKNYYYTIRVY